MGVDVSHIVRHDFKQRHDIEACVKFVVKTASKLKTVLHDDVFVRREDVAWKDIEEFGWYKTLFYPPENKNYPPEFSIRLNRYDLKIILRDGFWQIESYYHYCRITMAFRERLLLREMISDIVRALGATEVWHAEEYYTWNCPAIDTDTCTYDEWMAFIQSKGVVEYDADYWLAHQDEWPIPPIFHDDITDLNNRLDQLQQQWQDYKILGLLMTEDEEYVVEKEGKCYWLDSKTGETSDFHPENFDNIEIKSDVENYI